MDRMSSSRDDPSGEEAEVWTACSVFAPFHVRKILVDIKSVHVGEDDTVRPTNLEMAEKLYVKPFQDGHYGANQTHISVCVSWDSDIRFDKVEDVCESNLSNGCLQLAKNVPVSLVDGAHRLHALRLLPPETYPGDNILANLYFRKDKNPVSAVDAIVIGRALNNLNELSVPGSVYDRFHILLSYVRRVTKAKKVTLKSEKELQRDVKVASIVKAAAERALLPMKFRTLHKYSVATAILYHQPQRAEIFKKLFRQFNPRSVAALERNLWRENISDTVFRCTMEATFTFAEQSKCSSKPALLRKFCRKFGSNLREVERIGKSCNVAETEIEHLRFTERHSMGSRPPVLKKLFFDVERSESDDDSLCIANRMIPHTAWPGTGVTSAMEIENLDADLSSDSSAATNGDVPTGQVTEHLSGGNLRTLSNDIQVEPTSAELESPSYQPAVIKDIPAPCQNPNNDNDPSDDPSRSPKDTSAGPNVSPELHAAETLSSTAEDSEQSTQHQPRRIEKSIRRGNTRSRAPAHTKASSASVDKSLHKRKSPWQERSAPQKTRGINNENPRAELSHLSIHDDEEDENGFKVIKRFPDDSKIEFKPPRARTDGFTDVRVDGGALTGIIKGTSSRSPLFIDDTGARERCKFSWRVQPSNDRDWSWKLILPRMDASGISKNDPPMNVQGILRSMGMRPPHRAHFCITEKDLKANRSAVLQSAARAAYIDHCAVPLEYLSMEKKQLVLQTMSASYFQIRRQELENTGYTVLRGMMRDGLFLHDNLSKTNSSIQDEVKTLWNHVQEKIPSSENLAQNRISADVTKMFQGICNINDSEKDSLVNNALNTRVSTKTRMLNQMLEEDELDQVLYCRCRVDIRLAQLAACLQLQYSSFGSEKWKHQREQPTELLIPDGGGRILATLSECADQVPHTDFALIKELEYPQVDPEPSYSLIATGKEGFKLWVLPSSHMYGYLDAEEEKLLAKVLKLRLVEVPPYSVLFIRGDVIHAGASSTAVGKKLWFRYHLYFQRKGSALADAVIPAKLYTLQKQHKTPS